MQKRSKYNLTAILVGLIILELVLAGLSILFFVFADQFLDGIRFHNEQYIVLLFFSPIASLLFFTNLFGQNKKLARIAKPGIIPWIYPGISSLRKLLSFFLFRIALTLVLVALIGPKIGSKIEEVETKGIEILLALDVSKSMEAEDIQPSRIEVAKRGMQLFINRLSGDRVGIIVFAGDAFVQLPLTSDYAAAKLFLGSISTDMLSTPGTDLSAAMNLAEESFSDEGLSKALILITDGEDHAEEAITTAQKLKSKGIQVHSIGMGSLQGAPIPIKNSRGKKTGYKKDSNDNPVMSALNEDILRQIADETEGVFVRASANSSGFFEIHERLNELEKSEMESIQYSDYAHKYQYFLLLGLIFFLCSLIISESSQKWSRELNIFDPS